ncbi:hypothetical protein MLD38_012969 [Melastoma candidum]|uniref:Uncharacterized protein n=1 Tax=Melastoma candidum TaxID=119954 RepID=A0ACB9R821_9MYRT|nr:hypothetical protein MLD38_012969 [Melastoma candidum]
MEGMGGFSDAEFDLLGMLFPGCEPDSVSLSQYPLVDDGSLHALNAVGVNTAGFDEDYSFCSSLVNTGDSRFQWNSDLYVPAMDYSTVVNSERVLEEKVTEDSQVGTGDGVPGEGPIVAGRRSKHKRKSASSCKSTDTAVEISETPKKRPRQSSVKRQGSVRTRRSKKPADAVDNETNDDKNNGDGENPRREGQSPITSCSSEEDVNSQQLSASDDLNPKASSSANNNVVAGVKPRAGRGAATDPQSLYARKRRERINERLKILQNLIPNGTKVDISTMLEEAVHYVKFLQVQIKLLSSDEMWMYAPIAYNGKDIGLNRLFSSQL